MFKAGRTNVPGAAFSGVRLVVKTDRAITAADAVVKMMKQLSSVPRSDAPSSAPMKRCKGLFVASYASNPPWELLLR